MIRHLDKLTKSEYFIFVPEMLFQFSRFKNERQEKGECFAKINNSERKFQGSVSFKFIDIYAPKEKVPNSNCKKKSFMPGNNTIFVDSSFSIILLHKI